ncbi:MAG: DUF3565 domain-containing protein [Acidobacteriaceae bacterium]
MLLAAGPPTDRRAGSARRLPTAPAPARRLEINLRPSLQPPIVDLKPIYCLYLLQKIRLALGPGIGLTNNPAILILIFRYASNMVQGKPSAIVGFHQDEQGDWVADLSCGHTQHVRHRPPWELRPWVIGEQGRAQHLGTILICKKCLQRESS